MPTKRTSLIDDRSGEIVYENTEYRSWQDAMVTDKGIHVFPNSPTIRLFPGIMDLLGEMKFASYGTLIKTMMHMDPDNSLPPNVELAEKLDVSLPTIARHYMEWRACGAVRKNSRRVYYVNPLYGLHGKWLNVRLYRLFQNELDPVLPAWVKERFAKM